MRVAQRVLSAIDTVMTGAEQDIQWFIARDGKQHGPLSEAEMRTFVSRGHLRASDLIWRPGFSDWRPAPAVFPGQSAVAQAPAPALANPTTVRTQPTMAPMSQAPHSSPFIRPEPAPQPEPYYQPAQADGQNWDDADPPRRGMRGAAIAALLLLLLAGGGVMAFKHKDRLSELASLIKIPNLSSGKKADAKPEPAAAENAKEATAVTTAAANPADAAAPVAPEPKAESTKTVDDKLQKIGVWSLVKQEFPDWYNERLVGAAKLLEANKPNDMVDRHMVEGLVALRRENAEKALAANPAKLKTVASTFLDNIKRLRSVSTDTCYAFISQGELSPVAMEQLQRPDSGAPIQAQLSAIFDAIADGRKTPTAHTKPAKADYDALVAELTKLGWSQTDLQLFSNPKLLSRAPAERVCQMVQDWFSAHLAVADDAMRDRLLIETLRPVISG